MARNLYLIKDFNIRSTSLPITPQCLEMGSNLNNELEIILCLWEYESSEASI